MAWRRIALLVLALVALAGALPVGTAGAVTALEVDAGYGGAYRAGAPVPVRVRIAADRLVRGELSVRTDADAGGEASVTVAVEAPGGTVREVLVMAPTNLGPSRSDVVVVLSEGGAEVARGRTSVAVPVDQEVVALLPGLLAGRAPPGAAPLAVDAGTARFSALGPGELAAAPASLAALDVVGAGPDDLGALDDDARSALLTWVGAGGTLMVDSGPGDAVAALPEGWQPGPGGRVLAGLGEVRATGGAMAAGDWPGLIEPTSAPSNEGNQFFGGFGVDGALATDAGLQVPQLGWLIGFLAVYVLLAVPLTLTLLRRGGRGELGWVVLPLVALVFTAASYGAGRTARGDTTAAYASVVHVTDGGALATTSVGLVSPSGGETQVDYPRRWTLDGRGNFSSGPLVETEAALGSDGMAVHQRLDIGQFGVQRATGPVTSDGKLEISAVATGETTLEGRVRNTFPFAIEEVAVLQDGGSARLGRLEPGEERGWTLAVPRGQENFPGPAAEAWPTAAGVDRPPDPDSVVAFPLWAEFQSSLTADVLAPGTVVVAGWTRELPPPLDVPTAALSGRTLVVGTAAVASGSAGVVAPAVRTSVVRSPFQGGAFVDDSAPTVFRMVLPQLAEDAGARAPLVVRAPQGLALDTWVDGEWRELAAPSGGEEQRPNGAFGPAGGGARSEHALPPEALAGGVVWVRARTGGFGVVDPFSLANSSLITLGTAS